MRNKENRAQTTRNARRLEKYARDTDYRVRRAVAQNPHTPYSTLASLVHAQVSPSEAEKAAILNSANPRIPRHVIESRIVAGAVADNPRATMDLLQILVEKGHLQEVARRKDLSAAVIQSFQHAPRHAMFNWLQRTAYGTWQNDLSEYNESVINLIAEIDDNTKRFGPNDAALLFKYRDQPNRLDQLAGQTLREVLARCRGLTDRTLIVLAQSQDPDVHYALAKNPSRYREEWLPREAALAMSKSEDWHVLLILEVCSTLTEAERAAIRQRKERHPAASRTKAESQEAGRIAEKAAASGLESPAEEAFWRALTRGGHRELEGVVTQFRVGKYRIDFALPEKRIGIEIDGFRYHSSQADIVSDRQRQRALEHAKWRIVRFAAKEVFDDADECVRQAALWIRQQGS